jgi:hypothetical protein
MDGDVFGPYSAKEMSELEVLPDIMVTENNMDSWVPASEIDFIDLAKKELLEKLKLKPSSPNMPIEPTYEERKAEIKRKLLGSSNNQVHTNFPEQIEFKANFNEGLNSIGGKIYITPTQIIFHPHVVNFGDLSDRIFNICDITGYEKGILSFLYISFDNGTRIKLTVWNKQNIINELEARRSCILKLPRVQ